MVSVSGSLACQWGFSIWQSETEYNALIKLLVPFGTKLITSKLKLGGLKEYEEIKLHTNNAPEKKPLHFEKQPDIFNHEIEIEI